MCETENLSGTQSSHFPSESVLLFPDLHFCDYFKITAGKNELYWVRKKTILQTKTQIKTDEGYFSSWVLLIAQNMD